MPAPCQGEPFMPGITFASSFHAAGDPASSPFTYGRFHNPTWSHFENALSELEGGPAIVFSSGMAATAAVLGTTLQPADVLLMASDSYYTSRLIADGFFAQSGVQVRKSSTEEIGRGDELTGVKLLLLETPSNPGLNVCDIAALSEAAHRNGTLVAVDNTTATMLGQNPLELGADFSLASDTKALTGHSDLILGHVAVRDDQWFERLKTWRTQMGAVPGPMEVWLAHRSLATLEMRLDRQCSNAQIIAEFLKERAEVRDVRYPGLPTDPSHETASRQMRYFGPVVSFILEDKAKAERFLGASKLISEATSFGSIHTTAERRARWGGDVIPEGFIRLSVGCEDHRDLISDFEEALKA